MVFIQLAQLTPMVLPGELGTAFGLLRCARLKIEKNASTRSRAKMLLLQGCCLHG